MTISAKELRERLNYDPVTGHFTWTLSQLNLAGMRGKKAGNLKVSTGYITIQVDGVQRQAHVWAWLYMTGSYPDGPIDHRDRDRANNAWDNLRLATKSENNQNAGFTGLSYSKRDKYWTVTLKVNGKSHSGGGSRCFGKAFWKRAELKLKLHPSSPECTGLRDKLLEWKRSMSAG